VKLLRRRSVWLPTVWGWLVLLLVSAAIVLVAVLNVYAFLSPNHPVGGRVLVVEGWMLAPELDQALRIYRAGHYERLITTGGPIEDGSARESAASYAEQSRDYLVRHGLAPDAVVAVPAPASAHERSYLNAVMVREWVAQSGVSVDALDLLSSGAHTRRSWMLNAKAFGPQVKVGIIAVRPSNYDTQHWWRSSTGAKDVITEAIAWLWTELFFHPGPPGSPDEKQETE
jgi:hypothetical protein